MDDSDDNSILDSDLKQNLLNALESHLKESSQTISDQDLLLSIQKINKAVEHNIDNLQKHHTRSNHNITAHRYMKHSGQEVFDTALEVLMTITGSLYGYIAETRQRQDLETEKNPNGLYLQSLVITNIPYPNLIDSDLGGGLGSNTECVIQRAEFTNMDTLFGISLLTETVVITDDLESDKRRGGRAKYPSDHTKLTTFMAIPIMMNGTMIGQIGLANCPELYTDNTATRLMPLVHHLGIILYYIRVHADREEILSKQSMSKAKNLLMANVSHELRTPLNAIMGMLAILEDTELDDHQWDCTEVMRDATFDLLALINDILDISKLEAGEMRLYPTSVSISEILESSYKLVGQMAFDKGLDISYSDPETGGVPGFIIADPNRLKQMLKNLLSNAIKFTPEGRIYTTVEIATDEEVSKMGLRPIKSVNIENQLNQIINTRFPDETVEPDKESISELEKPNRKRSSKSNPQNRMFSNLKGLFRRTRSASNAEDIRNFDNENEHEKRRGSKQTGNQKNKQAASLRSVHSVPTAKHSLSVQSREIPEQLKSVGVVNPATGNVKLEELGDWVYLKFSVIDTGIGIAHNNIHKLFRSFTQIDGTSTKEYEGTGLGLSITHRLCELMGGAIDVESVEGQGSNFHFIIPVQVHIQKVAEVLDLSLLDGKTFLVVDDNAKNLMRLTQLLDKWNVDYRECESPKRALMSYINNKRFKFDLGLLDVVMPEMTGNELAAKISSSDNPFPLIALSSANQKLNSISPAFETHLTKPYSEEELLRKVLQTLNRYKNDQLYRDGSSELKNRKNSKDDKGSPYKRQSSDEEESLSRSSSDLEEKQTRLVDLSKLYGGARDLSCSIGLNENDQKENKGQKEKEKGQKEKEKEQKDKKEQLSYAPSSEQRRINRRKAHMANYYEAAKNADINILIAEDKPANLHMLTTMLNKIGYRNIDSACNGFDAVEKVKANRGRHLKGKSQYDVILMDIIMPKMDGMEASLEITKLFKKREHRPKIIAVTARVVDDAEKEYRDIYEMDDVIFKPINSMTVLSNALKDI